jgi:NADPH-dependent glutamate synthase beta subunit-like oxidoreductase
MPRELVAEELNGVLSTGIDLRRQPGAGQGFHHQAALLDEKKFDAVCVAIGAHKGITLPLDGETKQAAVEEALEFLHDVNIDGRTECGKHVVVVGGGDAASDAARVALRLGAETATIVYRRSEDEMPMDDLERRETVDEGVTIEYLTQPVGLVVENGCVTGLRCVRTNWASPMRPVGDARSQSKAASSSCPAIT